MSILRLLSICAIALSLTACGGGGMGDGSSSGSPSPPSPPGPPGGGSGGFYLPYEAASASTGETGLFVIPSNSLTTTPIFVAHTAAGGQSGIAVLASSKKQTLSSASIVTTVSPYALLYLAAGRDGNTHAYAVNLSDTSVAPTATQVSSLSLSSASDLCNIVGQAQTNVYDPTTLFVVLRTNAGGAASCGTGDLYQVVHYSDASTVAPALVNLNVAPLGTLKALYQPGGALGGLVLLDSSSGNLDFYANSTFTAPTVLVSGVTNWYSLADDSGINNTGLAGASVAFLSVTTHAGASVWRVAGAGSASNVYTASGILGVSGVADANSVYFTDFIPLSGTKVYQVPIVGGPPLELYEATTNGSALLPVYSLVGSNGTTLVLTASNVSVGNGSSSAPGSVSTSLLALTVGTAGTPRTIAGPFSSTVAASMCPAKWADVTSSLVVLNMVDITPSGSTGTFAYSSEVLTPDGSVKQPRLDNSYFLSGPLALTPPCGLEFGSLLQARGITDTSGGYGGATVNAFDLSSFSATVLTTTTGSGSYSVPSGEGLLGGFLADNIGSGTLGSTLENSLGVAFDLSKKLIVTIGVPNAAVIDVPLASVVPPSVSVPSPGPPPTPGQGTSLSCDGFPRDGTVFSSGGIPTIVQVCRIITLTPPLTTSLSVTSNQGNVVAHGSQTETAISVYARIIAQDVTAADATNLANSITVSTANGTVSIQQATVNYPQSLEVDYEVLTPSTTAVSLSTNIGNVYADNYTSMLSAMTDTGDIALQAVNGNVQARANTGNIAIGLSGTAWTGAGLTATTGAGNILLLRPAGYQALVTATTDAGLVAVDGQTKAFPFPATLTTGSGQPINLTSDAGNVAVQTN